MESRSSLKWSMLRTVTRTASSQIGHETAPQLPAAKAGTLSARTDDNTGVVTLAAGHGLEVGDVVDVYWSGSGNYRYGMDVTVVDGNDVTVDGGAGADNLTGGFGDDLMLGRGGNDLVRGTNGEDLVSGGLLGEGKEQGHRPPIAQSLIRRSSPTSRPRPYPW